MSNFWLLEKIDHHALPSPLLRAHTLPLHPPLRGRASGTLAAFLHTRPAGRTGPASDLFRRIHVDPPRAHAQHDSSVVIHELERDFSDIANFICGHGLAEVAVVDPVGGYRNAIVCSAQLYGLGT